jgi:hypothetical protein
MAFSSLSNAASMDDKKMVNTLANGGITGAMVTCLGTTKNKFLKLEQRHQTNNVQLLPGASRRKIKNWRGPSITGIPRAAQMELLVHLISRHLNWCERSLSGKSSSYWEEHRLLDWGVHLHW